MAKAGESLGRGDRRPTNKILESKTTTSTIEIGRSALYVAY